MSSTETQHPDEQLELGLPNEEPDELRELAPLNDRNEDLSRQVRNLLLLYPITRLETEKLRLGPENQSVFKGVDTLYLSFSMFDFISECMRFEGGATRERIIEHLSLATERVKPTASGETRGIIAEIILDQLCNSKENHRSFLFEYYDAAEETMKSREFRLILYKIGDDGEGRYFLTNEGFSVYFSMLELDSKTGQEVDEYLIRKFMDRGDFGDALRIAKRNRKRTIELKDTLDRKLFQINRDILNINWSRDIRPYIDESRTHIRERIEEEGSILGRLTDNIEATTGKEKEKLVDLQDTIQECQSQHRKLHNHLMGFNEKFLSAQGRAFRTPRISNLAGLEEEILSKMVEASLADLSDAAPDVTACMNQPKIQKMFDPLMLLSFIDNADRELEEEEREEEEDLVTLDPPKENFDKAMIREMTKYLEKKVPESEAIKLSQLIAEAEKDQLTSDEILCLIYLVMQWYGDNSQSRGITLRKSEKYHHIDKDEEQREPSVYFSGDNLSLQRGKE